MLTKINLERSDMTGAWYATSPDHKGLYARGKTPEHAARVAVAMYEDLTEATEDISENLPEIVDAAMNVQSASECQCPKCEAVHNILYGTSVACGCGAFFNVEREKI